MEKFGLLALQGGGGSGGGLPPVTSADNGKALTVVNGEWAAAEDEFVVTFTKSGSTWSADKNSLDIYDALSAKKRVYGKVAGSSVTGDGYVSLYTLLVPLEGTSNNSGYVFGGAYQSDANTVFCTFIINGISVTAYTKTVAIDPEPLVVTYTITGLPTDNRYPMSSSHTLAQIRTALETGREVKSYSIFGSDEVRFPLIGCHYTDGDFDSAAFNGVALINGVWAFLCINQYTNGVIEEAKGIIIPVITGTMEYNSITNTLAFTQ